jgi:hypothetical protein
MAVLSVLFPVTRDKLAAEDRSREGYCPTRECENAGATAVLKCLREEVEAFVAAGLWTAAAIIKRQ